MLFFAFYVYYRLFVPLNFPFSIEIMLFITTVLSSQSIVALRFFLSPSSTFFSLIGYISAFFGILATMLALHDILFLFVDILFSVSPLSFFPSVFFTFYMLVFSFFASLYGLLQKEKVKVYSHNILNKKIPSPLRIIHVSDFHMGSTTVHKRLKNIVSTINSQNADLILITGDIIDGEKKELEKKIIDLQYLQAKYGSYIVLGNHEEYYNKDAWISLWKSWNFNILCDEAQNVNHSGAEIHIIGFTDSHHKQTHTKEIRYQLLKNITDDTYNIVMDHRPKHARYHAEFPVDLQLSGHTHGGQYFCMFPLISAMNKAYRSGFYTIKKMLLHVSNGVGYWAYLPIRIGTTAQITLITVKNSK